MISYLSRRIGLLASIFLFEIAGVAFADSPAFTPSICTEVRLLPRQGLSVHMPGGKIQGSNLNATSGFVDLAEIRNNPTNGDWVVVPVSRPAPYRFLRYYAPPGSYANIAEIEFRNGSAKIAGTPFGTFGSRDNSGNTYAKAFDGDPKTYFEAPLPDDQYLGIDLTSQAPNNTPPANEPVSLSEGTHRHFHIGNSLTDTTGELMQAIAVAAGFKDDFFDRWTMPGAPIHGLWKIHTTGGGFGHRPATGFALDAPLTDIVGQQFVLNGDNDAAEPYVGFYDLAKQTSPDVRIWVYAQWAINQPLMWEEQNQGLTRYAFLAAHNVQKERPLTPPVSVIPTGFALGNLKKAIEGGNVPGQTDFFKTLFADGLHLTADGRYFIGLVLYSRIYEKSPVGVPLISIPGIQPDLTPEQTKIYEQIAWDSVVSFRDHPEQAVAVSVPAEIDIRAHAGAIPPIGGTSPMRFIPSGTGLTFFIRPATPGVHQLVVTGSCPSDTAKPLKVLLNDKELGSLDIMRPPANRRYSESKPFPLSLHAGLNVLELIVPEERPYDLNTIKVMTTDGGGVNAEMPWADFLLPDAVDIKPGETFTRDFTIFDAKSPVEKLKVDFAVADQAILPTNSVKVEQGTFKEGNSRLTISAPPRASGECQVVITITNEAGKSRILAVRARIHP